MSNTAIVPAPKIESDFYDWFVRHESKCNAARANNHEIVFIGDSITHLFEGHPCRPDGSEVWRKFYGRRSALNLGYGYDRTQNVLWRLANGELHGQTPKLVVLNIGTNNLTATANCREYTAPEIVEGILAVCDEIHRIAPSAHILVMAIFPRDKAASPLRARVNELNALLKNALPSRSFCELADIGRKFLDSNGEIPLEVMPDLVHPSAEGYRLWAGAIEATVRRHLTA